MAIFTGDDNDNVLIGSTENDRLFGLGGNDVLDGGLGIDQFDGGEGFDTVTYDSFTDGIIAHLQTGSVSFVLGQPSESLISIENLIGSRGNDSITGSSGNDTFSGNAGRDSLFGRDGVDVLDGGDGDDVVSGDKGDDTMLGGAGDDRLLWIDGDGSDIISGGAGNDTVQFTGATTFAPNGGTKPGDDILTLGLDFNTSKVLLKRTSLGPVTLTLDSVETVFVAGVEGNDGLTVGELAATDVRLIQFRGLTGNDFINAFNSVATIDADGGDGNDSLVGGNRDDLLEGGAGNDFLTGRLGSDRLIGVNLRGGPSPGRGEQDTLVGGAGPDPFILGDRESVTGPGRDPRRIFYDDGDNNFDGGNNVFTGMDGVSDFALITDFAAGDTIQLAGTASQYVIRDVGGSLSRGSAAQDVGIFKARPNLFAPDELIAIVQDVGSGTLNLNNRNQFVFV
ncbi:MAG: hypothetical protein IGS38_18005 [Synechococcales cyanobacterium M58_A2018_015]|nr:hypothetical protein [Synechococcales cyanobacterium M58_A2018_015]